MAGLESMFVIKRATTPKPILVKRVILRLGDELSIDRLGTNCTMTVQLTGKAPE